MDEFVIAHTLGWFAKAIVLRDYWFCWILSILFEVMEYSLQHQLPNFAECWWDHVRNNFGTQYFIIDIFFYESFCVYY